MLWNVALTSASSAGHVLACERRIEQREPCAGVAFLEPHVGVVGVAVRDESADGP
jgi:hypothetical protein